MIIELNDIKEVEIVAKADFKYYMLYVYNKNVKELTDWGVDLPVFDLPIDD